MNDGKKFEDISKEFNKQFQSTGHFETFSPKAINIDNQYFINNSDENKFNIRTKYDKIFSNTNPNNLHINNIKFNNDIENSNLSFENIKFLPNYFIDIEEALKKSNNNVQELKETIKQKINEEKKLKNIIEKLKLENNKLLNLNEELTSKINKYELNIKNMKDILQTKINNLGEDIQGIDIFKKEIKKIQEENYKLSIFNKKLLDENYKYINEIKKLKIDIKKHLYEKMKFIKMNNLNQEQKIINSKLNNIINDNKNQIRSLSKENNHLKDIQKDYQYLSNNYKKITDDNILYKQKMQKKENIEKNFEEFKEKYDKEKFEFICQINIWKNNFLSIAKYKLFNYNPNYDQNLINIMRIEEQYLKNAPNSIKILAEKILIYFKELIDQQQKNKDNSNNNKELEESKDKIYRLKNKLDIEKTIRRNIFFKYLNLRGKVSIMCYLKPFPFNDNNELVINKNSQIDTFIINTNNIIIKKNNDVKKYEFDYIFKENNTHQDFYEEIYPLIHSIFKGNNIIILIYGQKRNEKSFNILGDNNSVGILGRSIQEIFYILNSSNKDKYINFQISVNIIYILNEEIYNLLDKSTPKIKSKNYEKMIKENLISTNIKSFEEFDKLLKLSKQFEKNSKIFEENNTSFHYIYSFNIILTEKEGQIIQSTLTFIDFGKDKKIHGIQNKDIEYMNKEIDGHNDVNEHKEMHAFPDDYLFSFITTLSNGKLKDYKDWNKYILINFLKNYVNSINYKFLFLLKLDRDIDELDETLKILNFCQGIIPKQI